MATIRNTRDKILQAQSPRNLNPSLDKVLFLNTDTPVFNISNSNVGSPAVINFTAKPLNIFGTVVFTVTSGTATLTGTGNTRALAYSDMSSDSVTVSASVTYQGITYTALQIVSKVRQGANGLTNAIIYAYQRSATVPTLSPGAITYDFTSATITVPAGNTLANGWSKTIPSGNDPLYITGASASGNGGTDGIAANEWSSASLFAVNGENGVNGLNVATVRIYQKSDSVSPPPLPTNPATFTFSTGVLTGLNNGWSATVPSVGGAYLYTSSASAASTETSDVIQPSEWAAVSILSEDGINGTDGVNGTNTAQAYAYKRSSTFPTDSPGAVTYTFSSASITTPSGHDLLNGWTKTIPNGNDPLYVKVASASSIDAADNIASNEWTDSSLLALNGENGVNGLNVATVRIYQKSDSAALPAAPSANVSFTFATGATTGLNNGWSNIVPAGSGAYLYTTSASAAATGSSDTILPSEWASVSTLSEDGIDGNNTAQAYAYKRSATLPTDSPGDVTYTFATANITTPSGNSLANGWSKTIPSGSDPLYVKVGSASSKNSTDSIASNEWTDASLLALNGVDGVNSATVYIYQRTVTNTAPALPSANVTYTFSTATSSGLNNGWSATIPGGTGDYLFVSTATAVSTGTSDVILPSEWAAAQILGTKGSNGAQGSSARVAYVLVNSSSLNTTPPSATVSGDSLPATGTWGETNTWQTTSPTGYVAGQSVWVSNGLYDPVANTTTWNVPYLANLKVGSLSIITPNLGSITQGALNINNRFVVLADGTTTISSADSGARTVYNNTGVKVYDGVATLPRVELGLLS